MLPIARLTQVGLILLRLSGRWSTGMAGLLNRNIILFKPVNGPEARVQRSAPAAGDPERAGACPHWRSKAGSIGNSTQGAGRPGPVRLRWSDPRAARSGPGDPAGRGATRDPGRGGGRAAHPVDSRAAHRPHGPIVRPLAVDRYLRLLNAPPDPPPALARKLASVRREEPGGGGGPGRQLPGPPDPARAGCRLLPGRLAGYALPTGLSRPPGGHDRQRDPHGRPSGCSGFGSAFFILFVFVNLVTFPEAVRRVVNKIISCSAGR